MSDTYATEPRVLTKKVLEDAMDKLWELDPVAAWMREQGFDPRQGCKMVVPKLLWEQNQMPERSYVMKSEFADQIYLMREPPPFVPEFDCSRPEPEKKLSWWRKLLKLIGVK